MLLPAVMLFLPIILAAKALAATTYTVTIIGGEPDQRTLGAPVTTDSGDVVTWLTVFPDGVDPDGQTRYARQTGVTADQTVSSLINMSPSTTPTVNPTGTVTRGVPVQEGHHVEVLTVTDPNRSTHEVTRIDEKTSHVTVSAITESNVVFVPESRSTIAPDYATATVTAPSPTQGKGLGPVRQLPICNNGNITWTMVASGCYPLYDMMLPTPKPAGVLKPSQCTGRHPYRTITVTRSTYSMLGSTPPNLSRVQRDNEAAQKLDTARELDKYREVDGCEIVEEIIDFGMCGAVQAIAHKRQTLRYRIPSTWIIKWWWVLLLPLLMVMILTAAAFCLSRRRAGRKVNEKAVTAPGPTSVAQQTVPVDAVTGTATGTEGATSSTGGAAGSTGSTTTAPAAAAPAATEVVTTTTEPATEHSGTMRRAAEEGRSRVHFDEHPDVKTIPRADQVDGAAELRTGSEVFDVGSMRGRKRGRGDEPL